MSSHKKAVKKIPIEKRLGHFDKLVNEWRVFYLMGKEIDLLADKGKADWESLCVGWCLAKGLTIIQAYDFYQKMIGLNLF